MYKLEYRKRCIGITPFRWGSYFHVRWKQHWLHFKIGVWFQQGLQVSTRRQIKTFHRPRRYVSACRLNVSIWTTHGSTQGKPTVFGLMLYGGRTSQTKVGH